MTGLRTDHGLLEAATDDRQRLALAFREVLVHAMLDNARIAQLAGLRLSESQLLHLLEIRGPLTPTELGHLTTLSSATITGILDRLEHKKLVHRERHTDDRRKVVVVPDTAHVQRLLSRHYEDHAATIAAVTAQLTDRELAAVNKFLQLLIAQITPSDHPQRR